MEQLIDQVQINFEPQSLWVLNIALALVMFGVALEISVADFKAVAQRPKALIIGLVCQFVMLPLLTFVLVWLLKPLPSVALGMFMVAACPGGNVSNFMVHLAKGNTALSVSLTAMATLLAMLMTPFNLQLYGSLYPPTEQILKTVAIAPLQMVQLVGLLLGLPLVLGMLLRRYFAQLAAKLAKGFKIGSLLFFLLLVFLALYKNVDTFLTYALYVFWLVLLHNLLALLTGFSLARAFRLDKQQLKAITIETGIQNSGLGLLLIFTFFKGLGGMAIMAALWGVWHLVSGLALGSFWGYKEGNKKEWV